jgi:hypothetical protein
MNSEDLAERWYVIAQALERIVRRVERLPQREQDSEFREWLENALCHSERRAEALIDPS